MNNDLEQKYKQFKIDFKTMCAYEDMSYYNEITNEMEKIKFILEENIKSSLEDRRKYIHCDDDNTRVLKKVIDYLENSIDYLHSAICSFEDLKFYDGDGNRF